jgi:hypothetical protein
MLDEFLERAVAGVLRDARGALAEDFVEFHGSF